MEVRDDQGLCGETVGAKRRVSALIRLQPRREHDRVVQSEVCSVSGGDMRVDTSCSCLCKSQFRKVSTRSSSTLCKDGQAWERSEWTS